MEIVKSFGKYTIKQIFFDHWEEYLKKNLMWLSPHIVDEVERMLACRDPLKSGYHMYACPEHPLEKVYVPHSCKSRFCNVCGVNQTNKWMNEATSYFPNCGYFHLVFTIPDTLWYFFNVESKKPLLDVLFKSANETVLGWFRENRKVIPGSIAVLHTFGKKLNYNTHIHMIISAGGLKQKNGNEDENKYVWKDIKSLPWKTFNVRWKANVLNRLNKYIENYTFYADITKKRWYSYSSKIFDNPEFTCNYIGRYSKRPLMAETRITYYDGDFVTFYYDERNDNYGKSKERKYIRLPWEEFTTLLIQHIMPKQFKMVRHYGLFSNRLKSELLPTVFNLLDQKTKKPREFPSWRDRQTAYLGTDPLICKQCGKTMVLKAKAFWSSEFNQLFVKHINTKLSDTKKPRGYCAQLAFFEKFFNFF